MPQAAPIAGSDRVPLAGARRIGPTNPRAKVVVSLKLRRKRKLPELKGRPAAAMSRRALTKKYGASRQDIAKVVRAFARFGLGALDTDAATRTVRLAGTVAQLEQAFQTKLYDYRYAGGRYRGRVGAVRVPHDVSNVVEAVFGLDNRCVARRERRRTRIGRAPSKAPAAGHWYTPTQLASYYDFPAGDGRGQTVGLLEFGGGYSAADLRKFCKLARVAVPKVATVSTDGTPTRRRDGSEKEVMLDVEVIAGICPKARIVVYFGEWTEQGWITALDAVVHDEKNNPGVVSVSWGNAENTDIWTTQAITQVNEILKEAAYLGITFCAAAGDDGSSDAVHDGHAHVDFPGSSPYVLSVGGTSIKRKGGKTVEVAWKQGSGLRESNGGSTGGGVSAVLRRPAWQRNVRIRSVNRGSIVGRCVPDVAANADATASPYGYVVDGRPDLAGGTSAAAPLWAALLTLINAARAKTARGKPDRGKSKRTKSRRVGFLTPVLYQGAAPGRTVGALACNDIVSGNNRTGRNGGYHAGPGYDAVSGWGTPNGVKLLAALPG